MRPRINNSKCGPAEGRASMKPSRHQGGQTRRAHALTAPGTDNASRATRPDTHDSRSQLDEGAKRKHGQVPECSPKGECGKAHGCAVRWLTKSPLEAPTLQRGQAWTSQVEQGPHSTANSPRQSPVPQQTDWRRHHDHLHDHDRTRGIEPGDMIVNTPWYAE